MQQPVYATLPVPFDIIAELATYVPLGAILSLQKRDFTKGYNLSEPNKTEMGWEDVPGIERSVVIPMALLKKAARFMFPLDGDDADQIPAFLVANTPVSREKCEAVFSAFGLAPEAYDPLHESVKAGQ